MPGLTFMIISQKDSIDPCVAVTMVLDLFITEPFGPGLEMFQWN